MMTRRAAETAGQLNPQDVGNLMWAFATLGMEPGEEVVAAMARRALETAGQFNPQEAANVMWAYEVFGMQPGKEVVAAMSKRAVVTAGQLPHGATPPTLGGPAARFDRSLTAVLNVL